MAHFIARIRGNRGEASRLGSKQSGIEAYVQGWNVGVHVRCEHNDGMDVIRVYQTGGSNARKPEQHIATLAYHEGTESSR